MDIIIPILIGIVAYLFIGSLTRQLVRADMLTVTCGRRYEYPTIVITYFHLMEEDIVNICSMLWPLYYFYRVGAMCGKEVYKIIVKDDENRIATWFI